ncbi:MAG: hypothetical protein GWM90_29945 [Gemmatimonadetes bacterium]|nr:hypothetical protein [Gemmatimonadota bacterium]NIQ59310.1 hypothetical protein [Gemmatimonadota bacterium]NIX48134.1 hypothetical protein [Gemmatimonadota bacterium]
MQDETSAVEPGRGITREDLQLVIRRAAELYTAEADADERLSEAEVLRIADELGLPGRHVRQALYELPLHRDASSWIDRWYGPAAVIGTRVVPGEPGRVTDQLEDYLVTREFLQVLRRQGARAAFTPAEDAISNVARAVRRPQRQWQIARSRRVLVEARPVAEGESHVRVELDIGGQRSRAVTGGVIGGALIGIPLAAGAFFPVGHLVFDIAGDAAGYAAGLVAGAGAFGASVSAGLAVARSRFRSRMDGARLEIAGLLDRLESGRKLDPPPAPWLRSLRSRIADTLRPGQPSGRDTGGA